MRVGPFLIALVCVVVGTVLFYELSARSRKDQNSPSASDSGTTPTVREEKRPGPDKAERSEEPAPPTARWDGARAEGMAAAIKKWKLRPTDRDYLARFPDKKVARQLLAEWDLKAAIRKRTAKQNRPVPERVHRVQLDNGRTVWAKETERQGNKVQITMLNDIRVSFPHYEIRKDETLPGHLYLKETQAGYEREVLDLKDTPRDLLRAMGLALAREDLDRLQRFYHRWVNSGGAPSLAKGLPSQDAERVLAATRSLGIEKPRVIASTPGKGEPKEETLENLEPLPGPPDTVTELRRRMSRFNAHLKKRLSSSKRQRILDELLVCERWLEESGADVISDPSELRKFRQDIQFLRLDLLKAGEF